MLRQFLPAGATRTGQGPLGTPLFYAMREPGDLEQTILAGRCCISTSPNPAGRRSSTGGGTCTVTVTGQWPMGPGRLGCAAPAAPKRSQAGRLPVSQSLTYGKSVTDLRAACHWLPAPPAREGVWGGGRVPLPHSPHMMQGLAPLSAPRNPSLGCLARLEIASDAYCQRPLFAVRGH